MRNPKSETRSQEPRAAYRVLSGVAMFTLEGRPVAPLVVDLPPGTPPARAASCAEAGVSLFRLRGADLGWTGPNRFEHTMLEGRAEALMQAVPNARWMVEINVDAPAWWCDTNASECVGYPLPSPVADSEQRLQASWASQKWRTEAGQALTHLLRQIVNARWGQGCVGVQLVSGRQGHWTLEQPERLPDTGPRMAERFRTFLADKYRRNIELLRQAWRDTRPDFARATIPHPEARLMGTYGTLRDPVKSRSTLDFLECLAAVQNEACLHFCTVAQKAVGEAFPVGVACAPLFEEIVLAESGHAFPEAIFDSEQVDFVVGTGATGSLMLRDKFQFLEVHTEARAENSPPEAVTEQVVTLAKTVGATGRGLLVSADTAPEALRAAHRALTLALDAPRTRRKPAPIAFFVDPTGPLYVSANGAWLNRALLTDQKRQLERSGVAFDIYLISDLFHPRLQDHRLYLFANPFYLSETERRQIDARVKRSKQTALWLYAPGIITEQGAEASHTSRLCGMPLRVEQKETPLKARIVKTLDAFAQTERPNIQFGTDRPLAPAFTVTDRGATRLGANSEGKTVFAVRRFPNWTSVIYGAAPVPATLLRAALKAIDVPPPAPQETPPSKRR